MTITRFTAGTALLLALAACGGGDLPVRTTPQEVHPSPSFLANGVFIPVEGQAAAPAAAPCGHHSHHCHHGASYSKYDGSMPIVD
ncbi:MAG: hypothetical protein AB8B60_10740 [Sulfitobacter sp.]